MKMTLTINDIIKDENGVLGVVKEIDKTSELSHGILFTDVDEDNGLWWCKEESLKKVNSNSDSFKLFNDWYTEYSRYFEQGIRPNQECLNNLYKKYFVSA